MSIKLFIMKQQDKMLNLYLEATRLTTKLEKAGAKEELISKSMERSQRRFAEYKALVKVAREIQ
mgnify:CR=1 FL=1